MQELLVYIQIINKLYNTNPVIHAQYLEVGSDFTELRPFLSISKQFPSSQGSPTAGPRRECFTVSITDDNITENTETFFLFMQEDTFLSHTGAIIDSDQTEVTIWDDDGIFLMYIPLFSY